MTIDLDTASDNDVRVVANLRIAVNQTVADAGPDASAAAQEALDTDSVDGHLAYLNGGLHAAGALDRTSRSAASVSAR